MFWRSLLSLLKWALTLAALAGLFGLAYLVNRESREERTRAAKGEADEDEGPQKAPEGVVKLRPEQVEKAGIGISPVEKTDWRERVVIYGRVVPNPRATAEARAAFAGTLRAGPAGWPALGARVRTGQVLGFVDVRVGPQERLDLQAKLRESRLREQGAEKVLTIQQERADRLQMAGGSVSRAELDAARVQLAEARTQLAVAQGAVKQWQDALRAIDGKGVQDSTWRQPLTVPLDGEVTALPARPGTAVQAGDVVARVVDFRRPLVRLDLPPEVLAAGPLSPLFLVAATPPAAAAEEKERFAYPGGAARAVRAAPVGPAPQVDAASQLAGYWFEVASGGPAGWRPGLFVKGHLPLPERKRREAVAVPLTALLYYQERAVVFVRTAPGTFERRPVRVLGRDGNRWVLEGGLRPGRDHVVSRRAEALLSQAILASRPGDDDND
jgi:hypothetical protein